MSIRTIFLTIFVVQLLLLAGLGRVIVLVNHNYDELVLGEARRYQSYKLADELRQSSDDLTRMARTFVVTGDPKYETYFAEILAIRDGNRPRPENYGAIYWDFVTATGARPTEDGATVPLQQLMRDLGFSAEEFEKLAEAQDLSDALVQLENSALDAMKGRFDDGTGKFLIERTPDPQLARNIMHSPEYHAAKGRIMEPINEFFGLLESRTAREVEVLQAKGIGYIQMAMGLMMAAILFALGSLWILHRRVLSPTKQMIARLQDIAEGEGNLTRRVEDNRGDELGDLGRWFNAFIQKVHDMTAEVAGSTRVVAGASTEIATVSKQQKATASAFGESSSEISASVNEITAGVRELATMMGEVREVSQETASLAVEGRSDLTDLTTSIRDVVEGTALITATLSKINEKASAITGIVTAISKLADQTNLLSLNASIEAATAGEAGQSFAVVAREIGRQADETAVLTTDIGDKVQQMQAAVSSGVSEIDAFSNKMQQGVRVVASVNGRLGKIIERVEKLTDRFEVVNEGMSQQSVGAEQIRDSMGMLTENANQTVAALADISRTANHLTGTVTSLASQVGQFKLRE